MTWLEGVGKVAGGMIAAVLVPLTMRTLSRLAPARRLAADEPLALKAKYDALEIASQVMALVGGAAGGWWAFSLGKNSPWIVGTLFGGMVTAPVALIALFTVPRDYGRWDEFWLYYQWKYRVGLRLIFPLFGGLIGLGVVSAIMLVRGS